MKTSFSLSWALLPVIALLFFGEPTTAQEEAPAPETAPAETAAPEAAADGSPVLLTVDGTPITEEDVREILMARFGRQLQQMPPEQLAMVQQQMQQMVMTDLVSKALFINAANKEGFEAPEGEVEEKMAEIAKSLPDGISFEEYAAQAGVDLERIKGQVSDDIKIRQLFDKVTADVEKPEEAEVKTFYDENPEQFTQKATATASHILVSTQNITDEAEIAAKKKSAEDIKAQLTEAKGENFAELAGAHSDCPSKAQGGSLGEFGKGQMVAEFEKAAFEQEVGVVGELVETDFGYHIIQVTDRKEEKKLSYDEVKEDLAANLYEQKRGKKIEAYLTELRENAEIVPTNPPAAPAAPGGVEPITPVEPEPAETEEALDF
ncbi:MAG: peptidylprolyl isomerase [Verrucomicrobiota bacterium]